MDSAAPNDKPGFSSEAKKDDLTGLSNVDVEEFTDWQVHYTCQADVLAGGRQMQPNALSKDQRRQVGQLISYGLALPLIIRIDFLATVWRNVGCSEEGKCML